MTEADTAETLSTTIEHMLGPLSKRERIEVTMLVQAGITAGDVAFALAAYGRATRIRDEWPYIRTAAWTRAAERIELEIAVRAEVGR